MTFCEIILVGNLGRDPELHYTESGMARCNVNLAVNRSRRVNDEWVNETTWFRVTFWGREAETAGNLLQKGRQIVVVGDRIEANAYTGNDGSPRATLQVTARSFRLLGSRSESGDEGGGYSGGSGGGSSSSSGSGNRGGSQQRSGGRQSEHYENEYYDDPPENVDDIPF